MKNSHYYPHSGGILGCHAYVDFQQTNYLLNVTICEKLRCAHKLQTISDAFSNIASRFLKVALAIKFALNWLAGPQCTGPLHSLLKYLTFRRLAGSGMVNCQVSTDGRSNKKLMLLGYYWVQEVRTKFIYIKNIGFMFWVQEQNHK